MIETTPPASVAGNRPGRTHGVAMTIESVWEQDWVWTDTSPADVVQTWTEVEVHKVTPKRVYISERRYVDRDALERGEALARGDGGCIYYSLTPGEGERFSLADN